MRITDILLAIIGGGGVGGILRFVTKTSSAISVLNELVSARKTILSDHETRLRAVEQNLPAIPAKPQK